jgi:hypothetical protein
LQSLFNVSVIFFELTIYLFDFLNRIMKHNIVL